jgi:hypothetical protein
MAGGGMAGVGGFFFSRLYLPTLADEEPGEDSGQEYGKNDCDN